jgi:hypothetical protein
LPVEEVKALGAWISLPIEEVEALGGLESCLDASSSTRGSSSIPPNIDVWLLLRTPRHLDPQRP